jgi:DNA-binding transcriptional ArsR family regulator
LTAVARDAVFRALADPTRRAILERLRRREHGVGALCEPFDMTQPAISQHLRVLSEAGLVRSRRRGRERIYSLSARPLRQAFDWLAHFESFWNDRLDALGDHLDDDP